MDRENDQAVIFKFLWFLIIGSIVMFAGINLYAKENEFRYTSDLVSPKNAQVLSGQKTDSSSQVSKTLEGAISSALEGTKGTYAIYVKNLKTNELFYQNEHRVFDAGSLYKLWVMGTVYKKIEAGELTEDQVLSQSIPALNRKFGISQEDAELTEGGITQAISLALTQMITISHNYSALLLTEKIKLSSVAAYLEEHDFNESKVGTEGDLPKTTAYDIALFLEKLYQGKLANPENTQKMLDFLKAQRLNKKLPKYLPEGISVAHKTGELGWFSHDGGIVFSPKGEYIIVVLSESESPAGAEDRIALVSKAVFEYFEGR